MNRMLGKRGLQGVGHALCSTTIITGVLLLGFFANIHQSLSETPAPNPQPPKWVAQLPAGVGKSIIVNKCQFCHTLGKIVLAHRTRNQWKETVDSMREMGAPLTASEIPVLVDYLTANFGPVGTMPPTPASSHTAKSNDASSTVANHFVVDPDRVQFSPVQDSIASLKGIGVFVVSGDPWKSGPFSMLLKIPAGRSFPLDWLSGDKTIVCLRGIFQFSQGDALDSINRRSLDPGVILRVEHQPHRLLGQAKNGAIILVYGNGPLPIAGY